MRLLPPPLDLLPPLLEGISTTLALLAGGAVVAVGCAFAAGVGRWQRELESVGRLPWSRRLVRGAWGTAATWYVEVFRGTSALVQLFWFYFVLPRFGIDMGAMMAGILVLGLNTGAYGAEAVRGAMSAVAGGQVLAARALGFTDSTIARRIIMPQAIVRVLPPAGNLLIELLKNTALVSTIALSELTFRAQLLRSETLRTVEIFGLTLLLYFGIAQVIALGVRRLERTMSYGTIGTGS